MARKYEFSPEEVAKLHTLVDSEIKAFKNWIVTAVKDGDLPRAQELAREMDDWMILFKKTNVTAHKIIDKAPV